MPQFRSLNISLVILCPMLAYGVPHHMKEKRPVTGVVKDYDKKTGIVILEKFADWDRKQTSSGIVASKTKRRTVRWLQEVPKDQAAIWVKVPDMEKIRRGVSIEISDYHYIADEFTIYPNYRELKVEDKK